MITINDKLSPTNVIDLDQYFEGKFLDSNFYTFLSASKQENQCTFLLRLNNSKLAELYNISIKIHKGAEDLLALCQEQVKIMNRIAETETTWITRPLWFVCNQMIKVCDNNIENLETCGRLIHRSFNLCLNDRNPVMSENRKSASYSFANLEFIIYHKLKNRDMMKNLVKVLQSREMDKIMVKKPGKKNKNNVDIGQLVTYYYYLGEYYGCYESDFSKASMFLQHALLRCNAKCTSHISKILILLVPFVIVSKRCYPSKNILEKLLIHHDRDIYRDLLNFFDELTRYLKSGDIQSYDKFTNKNERFLLKKGIYVVMCQIRELVFLKFFKKCYEMIGENKTVVSLYVIAATYGISSQRRKKIRKFVNMKSKKDSQIPIDVSSLENKESDENMNELECHLANQINRGFIKGYLSHSNRCIVLSKQDAFPKLSTVV